ncbi:hypothetical protein [Pedobacter duraquae]|uniref:Uncharacterized protein n=1 Tax=Pedobacter duraquae TaxID=425511 RepID=A0A4R6IJ04_9SPHI|nr:hypothetical protein [Pedobacter duraquae]TDO21906.1 hypothetical protein CLV32_3014 [Pedobacter duraquae]
MKNYIEIKNPHPVDMRTYTVEFLTGNPFRHIPGQGKHWPKVTQCVIKIDGLIVSKSEVCKHSTEIDNPDFAKRLALKKAFKNYPFSRNLRVKFWNSLNLI